MEKALYSMIAYLQPALIQPVPHKSIPPSDAAPYTQWRKRGKDPEKFRALYPHGTVSLGRPPDMQTAAPRGETLFFHIATAIENEIRTGDYRGDN